MKRCYFCKGQIQHQLVTVDYRWGERLIIIRNVPAEACIQCNEKYFEAEVSRQMEHLVLEERKSAASIDVPVCEFVETM
ncbi:MAG: type II toxin-antitoxin system MqsA family antitoxin [Candidatus Omnitrophica bacterium]|nr:type II toxin-antitoxin system MqsA family antitoxin [Candidatus Omnitrophota bacterium]MBU0878413.1 type II toxin-antitoxin system MqsA family antitoxin [Candidatus Omnitrophota bacterium]